MAGAVGLGGGNAVSKGEGMEKMLEAYLAAVAAQLPKDRREDIVTELKDEILTRAEVREDELGRGLSDDEFEQLLREVGHPLVVAGRYAEGPQGIVGPELYPWWWFGVRMAIAAVVLVSVMGVAVQVLAGTIDPAQAIGRAIQQAITSGLMAIGCVTLAGWLIERQPARPKFLCDWKVKDLGMFEWSGSLNREAVSKMLATGSTGAAGTTGGIKAKGSGKCSHGFSPVAGAAASAVFTAVVLAWWLGLLSQMQLGSVTGADGLDYGPLLRQVHQLLYWPVAGIFAGRILFDVMRVLTGSPVRLTAAGDMVFSVANIAVLVWFWVASPLASIIQVPDMGGLVERLASDSWHTQPIAALLTAIVVFGLVTEVFRFIGAALRLATGKDRRQSED